MTLGPPRRVLQRPSQEKMGVKFARHQGLPSEVLKQEWTNPKSGGGGGKNHSKNASICLVLLFTIGSKLDKLAERGWSLILSNSATKSTSPPKMVLLVGTLACLPASQQLERCERAKNARLRVFPGVVWAGASTCSNDSKECRKHQQNHGIFNELKWPMKKTCCLGYIGGYITQLCGVLLYSKSLEDSYIKQPALMHGKWESFFLWLRCHLPSPEKAWFHPSPPTYCSPYPTLLVP